MLFVTSHSLSKKGNEPTEEVKIVLDLNDDLVESLWGVLGSNVAIVILTVLFVGKLQFYSDMQRYVKIGHHSS